MIAQFRQDVYNKSFSHQDQDKRDAGLERKFKFWLIYVVKMGGPIPDNVYDYDYDDPGLGYLFRGSKYGPEPRALENFLRINDSENN